jgi:hypothetical protein
MILAIHMGHSQTNNISKTGLRFSAKDSVIAQHVHYVYISSDDPSLIDLIIKDWLFISQIFECPKRIPIELFRVKIDVNAHESSSVTTIITITKATHLACSD